MKTSVYVISALLCCFFSIAAFAQQEKRYPDWHDLSVEDRLEYNSDPGKILPDARECFQKGEYGRTLMICSMHYVVYGDETREKEEKNTLEAKAKQCYDWSNEMKALLSGGDVAEAKKKAREIIEMNPQDKAALDVLLLSDPVVVPVDTTPVIVHVTGVSLSPKILSTTEGETTWLTVRVRPSDAADKSVVWSSGEPSIATVDQRGQVKAVAPGTVAIVVKARDGNWTDSCRVTVKPKPQPVEEPVVEVSPDTVAVTPVTPVTPETAPVFPSKPQSPLNDQPAHTMFVAKAGASYLIGFSSPVHPCIALGVYDLGGSRFGLEVGGYYMKMMGVDASLAVRLSKAFYLRAGAGLFSYSGTKGINAVLGFNFLIKRHFCLDIGAGYFPTIQTMGTKTVTTAGATYEMPVAVTARKAGIVPTIKIGWAF